MTKLSKILNQKCLEDEYLDYKQEFHTNKAKFIHDILCLSNAHEEKERYLIFGVDDNKSIVGVDNNTTGFLSSEFNFHNFIIKIDFNHKPSFSYLNHTKDGKEIVAIKIMPNKKPHFLIKDYKDKDTIVRAGVVYSRTGSVNTSIDGTENDQNIEKMYKARFGLHLPPLGYMEKIISECCTRDWNCGGDGKPITYIPNPSYQIVLKERIEHEFDEKNVWYGWTCKFADRDRALIETYALKKDSGELCECRVVLVDGYRYYLPDICKYRGTTSNICEGSLAFNFAKLLQGVLCVGDKATFDNYNYDNFPLCVLKSWKEEHIEWNEINM